MNAPDTLNPAALESSSVAPASAGSPAQPAVWVGIATAGRRQQMAATLQRLAQQTPLPAGVLVCPATPDDLDPACLHGQPYPTVRVGASGKGLTIQRNAILAELSRHQQAMADPSAVVLFIDDDFLPDCHYVDQVGQLFADHPDVVAACGRPLVDGATGPGVTMADALSLLGPLDATPPGPATLRDTYGTYGCNMAFRLKTLGDRGLRFDEDLPLYAWLEDIDFSRRVAACGRVVDSTALRGVHLGAKGGRVSGLRFGYSQVANPVHCVRKGSMSVRYASRQMARNVLANLFRAAFPEPWVDRRGRLRGNLLAFWHWATRRLHPKGILAL